MKFRYALRTRYSDTAQDGIIHHPSFVIFLEVARIEFFKSLGCDINDLERQKILCPVVELSVQYLKPLYSLEDILVEVEVDVFSKVRFSLKYQIFREQQCVAKASTTHCFLNSSFKPIAIPEKLLFEFKQGSC
ncbi:MAG: acyl-CoA thioesterase [Verrucomicrobia bacterium]|nr:acyl-CoA thioesterase [Verrucomicrobiota bacterium]MBS0646926.1 acyl-CoA thioesterase [Verrucomicrobiota bacterium]